MKRKEIGQEELIEYHQLQIRRKTVPYHKFSGKAFELKGDLIERKKEEVGEWFESSSNWKQGGKSEFKRNREQIELEKEIQEKIALKKRLLGNSSPLSPSKIVHPEEMFDLVFTPKNFKALSKNSSKCTVQMILLDGGKEMVEFQTEDRIKIILEYAIRKYSRQDDRYLKGLTLQTIYPRKKFSVVELDQMSIKQAELINGSVNIVSQVEGYVKSEKEELLEYEEVRRPAWHLRSDPFKNKEKFRKKVEMEKNREKEKERKSKRERLERVRKQMEYDKIKRRELFKMDPYNGKEETKKKKKSKDAVGEVVYGKRAVCIKLPSSSRVEYFGSENATLKDVEDYLIKNGKATKGTSYFFQSVFPKRIFKFIKTTSLKDTGQFPGGCLILRVEK